MFVPAVHFFQPTVNLLLDVQDVHSHLLLCDFQLALQPVEQRLTMTSIGWCLKRMVTSHRDSAEQFQTIPRIAQTLVQALWIWLKFHDIDDGHDQDLTLILTLTLSSIPLYPPVQ